MPEWGTYSLSDFLMFSPRTYYRLFELYNAAIWPAQVAAIALGFTILVLALRREAWAARAVAAILAACWLCVAWAYLLLRYDTINWAGSYLALGFAVEALLLAWTGLIRNQLRFQPGTGAIGTAGFCILLFALVIYPLIAPLLRRPWLQVEIFGVAPDPTVVATLGILVAARRAHWGLLIIPLLWCTLGGATLWTMQSPDALVLPAAAVLALLLTAWKSLGRGHGTSSIEPEDLRSSYAERCGIDASIGTADLDLQDSACDEVEQFRGGSAHGCRVGDRHRCDAGKTRSRKAGKAH